MRIVDSFTTTPFTGNPAAVVMLDATPPDAWLAAVARETNMTDTGFVIRDALPDADFRLRWFTPAMEVDLCGHATLAAAHCLFEDGASTPIRFASRSGVLTVARRPGGSLAMDFPAQPAVEHDSRAATAAALGCPVAWTGDTANGFCSSMMNRISAPWRSTCSTRCTTPSPPLPTARRRWNCCAAIPPRSIC